MKPSLKREKKLGKGEEITKGGEWRTIITRTERKNPWVMIDKIKKSSISKKGVKGEFGEKRGWNHVRVNSV